MVKAQSLIYAIYVCLIVALLCGALLYIANLYNSLNQYYVSRTDMYIHNQSLVNFALGNINNPNAHPDDDGTGVESVYEVKDYGLLKVVIAKSIFNNDTIASAHFAGHQSAGNTCIYLTNIGKSLFYSGNVKLAGEKRLPSTAITGVYIHNQANRLQDEGKISLSGPVLPEPTNNIKNFTGGIDVEKRAFTAIKKDSIFFNSFLKPTIELTLNDPVLANVNLKGNIIIRAHDSIHVSSTAHLEDVILIAPVINFTDGFKGAVQAYAGKEIKVGKEVEFLYPSALIINTSFVNSTSIKIDEGCKIAGAVVLVGNSREQIESHSIVIEKESLIIGDIYCSGKLTLKSNVYGSVYTNKFLHINKSSQYENCIADIEVNPGKRPDYYVSVPLFDKRESYGTIKKLM